MRPIYHQIESRVKAHIFVAALALLVQRLLARRLEEAGIDFSAERAMEALETVRLVTFRMEDRPERRGVSGGCPDAPGPEGIEVDRSEAADTPRGGRNRDVVTIRKIESCPPRGYVDGPQTWASRHGRTDRDATLLSREHARATRFPSDVPSSPPRLPFAGRNSVTSRFPSSRQMPSGQRRVCSGRLPVSMRLLRIARISSNPLDTACKCSVRTGTLAKRRSSEPKDVGQSGPR